MEKLQIVPQILEDENNILDEEGPEIDTEELDDICSLEVDQDDKQFFQNINNGKTIFAILYSLASRDLKNELPVSEQTFLYKRNLEECEKLKISVYKLIDKGSFSKKDDVDLLEDAATLLTLEKRKARWLEENYYPSLYGDAIESAKGEVNQFLIRQKNTAQLDSFTDNRDIEINLKDELTYLVDGNSPDSGGVYRGNNIDVRIPDYYTKKDEWKIFLVSVHELVHHASFQESGRIGIKKESGDSNQEEIIPPIIEHFYSTLGGGIFIIHKFFTIEKFKEISFLVIL